MSLRVLRGLASRSLDCGCLLGVYETYDGLIIQIVDAPGNACKNPAHQAGLSIAPTDDSDAAASSPEELSPSPLDAEGITGRHRES